MCVWGGGALMIRYAVRRWQLKWPSLLFLGLALAMAEECLIQQTSLAPLVVQIKGVVYARAAGVNYVYLLWALVYETAFVVFLPVYLVEMIFSNRRDGLWLSRGGLAVVGLLFLFGCFFAWFSWTQIARVKVFHLPAYNPPLSAVLIAVVVICGLIFLALGPFRRRETAASKPLEPPAPVLIGIAGAIWASLLYGLVLLGFGVAPSFPPSVAVGGGLLLAASAVFLLPRWISGPHWDQNHTYALIFGTLLGSMIVSFLGFIGSARGDLYFKVVVDLLAAAFMAALGRRVRSESRRK